MDMTLLQAAVLFLILLVLGGILFQLRRQQLTAVAQLNRSAASWRMVLLDKMTEDPGLARLVRVALVHWDELPAADKLSIHVFWYEMIMQFAWLRELEAKGFSQGVELELVELSALGLLVTPGGHAWWKESRVLFSDSLRRHVEAKLYYSHDYPAWTKFGPWQPSDEDCEAVLGHVPEPPPEPPVLQPDPPAPSAAPETPENEDVPDGEGEIPTDQ